ncbi:MAG: sigma-70 family RNA polymerase sigma factor [Actinomycetota bacterium]|nr:sigma-70 family RNA polymerase sigma factor [Actinomycetota bacterium]
MTATVIPVQTVGDRGQTGRDIALMQLVAAGDVDAFAELYDVMAPQVYGLIRRVLTDPAKAEQMTQDVMLTVWRTAARYHPAAGPVSTWMLTTAHGRAVEQARADQLCRLLNRAAAFEQTADQREDNLGHQLVKRCLAGLPHLQREALILAYYQGYTDSQVADILDASLPAIKSGIRAGLLRLHTGLEQARNSRPPTGRIDREIANEHSGPS